MRMPAEGPAAQKASVFTLEEAALKKRSVLVIGGGAGGLCAGVAAAEAGAAVTILEKRVKPGKKLLATGNGRCNLANLGPARYFGDGGFARQVLGQFPVERLLSTLEGWGLPLTREEERVYPAVRQASAVLSLLTERLNALSVRIVTEADVRSLEGGKNGFTARTADGQTFSADACVLATGGLAGGALGCTERDYQLAERLGHRVTPLFGALSPIETQPAPPKALSGLRLRAYVRLWAGKKCLQAESGEVLLTDYGVSGICVMQLARAAREALTQGRSPHLTVDLSPLLLPDPLPFGPIAPDTADRRPDILALLRHRIQSLPKQDPLCGLLPDALAHRLRDRGPEETARLLSAWPLPIKRVREAAYAQVTAGGVETGGVDPLTMGSRLCPGLYLAGELLNVDGACGGYNLQFAMISGILAGRSAAAQSNPSAKPIRTGRSS